MIGKSPSMKDIMESLKNDLNILEDKDIKLKNDDIRDSLANITATLLFLFTALSQFENGNGDFDNDLLERLNGAASSMIV